MFKSYEYVKYLGYDKKTKEYRYQYKIIDSDFEEVVDVVVVESGFESGFESGIEVAVAVIETYEKRNLNVAKNLMRAILCVSKEWKYSVQEVINYNKQYSPKFAKYEKDLEKYMLLL